jgi:hypothetical protein
MIVKFLLATACKSDGGRDGASHSCPPEFFKEGKTRKKKEICINYQYD